MRAAHLLSAAHLFALAPLVACPDVTPSVPDASEIPAPDRDGGGTGLVDGGGDGGDARDAGGVRDGGAEDGGGALDGGARDGGDGGGRDAGAPLDGGANGDGGALDAGSIDAGAADGGARDGGAQDGGAQDGGASPDGGAGFEPPASTYVLLSPPAASQAEEDDRLQASGLFVVEARVGHVQDLRSLGFVVRWDPASLTLVGNAAVTGWLMSNGGTVVVLAEDVDAAAGEIFVAMGVTGAPVSTDTSEAVYRLTFDFTSAPVSTGVDLDLSQDGLIQDGASQPMPGVVEVDLLVNP